MNCHVQQAENSESKCEEVLKELIFLPPLAYMVTNILIMQLAVSGLENEILSVMEM